MFTACNSKQAIEGSECSDAEQGLFLACIESGCSAEYTQSLEGADACSVEGEGSYVSIGAGAECGFSSSGSCYVVCDCGEGQGVIYSIEQEDTAPVVTKAPDDLKPEDITGYELRAILDRIDEAKASCNQSIEAVNQKLLEKDAQIADLQSKIDSLRMEDSSIYTYVDSKASSSQAALEGEIALLEGFDDAVTNSIADINTSIGLLNDSINDQQTQIDELYSSIGLIVSEYDVDCNRNNVRANVVYAYYDGAWVYTTSYTSIPTYYTIYIGNSEDCILVTGIPSGQVPIVQVYKDSDSTISSFYKSPSSTSNYSYSGNWGAGTKDGGIAYGSSLSSLYYGPGFQLRYDSSLGTIYTAPHYVSDAADKTPRTYHVTVIGTTQYTAP